MSVPSRLTDAEYEVMCVIWGRPAPIPSGQIAAEIAPAMNWQPATVFTILRRLAKKGFVSAEKLGRDLFYTPLVSREEYARTATEQFMKQIHRSSLTGLLSALYADEKPSEEETAQLERWLEERE